MKNKIKDTFCRYFHFWIILTALYFRIGEYTEYSSAINQKDDQVAAIKNSLARLKKRKQAVRESIEKLAKTKNNLIDTENEVERLRSRIPRNIRDTEILELLSQEAELLSIKNVFLKPQDEGKKGSYTTKKYELRATGTYLQFLVYFERLAKKTRNY